MTERAYPRWLYWADGTTALVASPAEEALLPPGHKDTFGKFLPPEHVGYVPDPDEAPGLPRNEDVDDLPLLEDDAVWGAPEQEVPDVPAKRKRGRPRKVTPDHAHRR